MVRVVALGSSIIRMLVRLLAGAGLDPAVRHIGDSACGVREFRARCVDVAAEVGGGVQRGDENRLHLADPSRSPHGFAMRTGLQRATWLSGSATR